MITHWLIKLIELVATAPMYSHGVLEAACSRMKFFADGSGELEPLKNWNIKHVHAWRYQSLMFASPSCLHVLPYKDYIELRAGFLPSEKQSKWSPAPDSQRGVTHFTNVYTGVHVECWLRLTACFLLYSVCVVTATRLFGMCWTRSMCNTSSVRCYRITKTYYSCLSY